MVSNIATKEKKTDFKKNGMLTAAFYKLMEFLPFVFIHYIFIVDKHFEISQLLKENSVKLSTSIPHVSSYKKTM